MIRVEILERYLSLIESLERVVEETANRVTDDSADAYFGQNINFLTKSFLISLCCYLEAFLKELANAYVADAALRLRTANIPHNLLIWAISDKTKDSKFGSFELPITATDIDEKLSGNPFKTAECLRLIGVDIGSINQYKQQKELVNSVVSKRNNIIHHNDSAADVSLGDVKTYCGDFANYLRVVDSAFANSGFN